MQRAGQQVRSAARRIWRNPRFAITFLAVLSLGVGTVSALFSVAEKVLLEPLPYPEPDRLVQLTTSTPIGDQRLISIPKYLYWRNLATSFESVAASDLSVPEVNFEEGTRRSTLNAARVSADYFHVLGAQIALGRTFSTLEDRTGGANVVVISNDLWQRYFGANPKAVGGPILLNGIRYSIVGILARSAHLESPAEVWFPLRADPSSEDLIPRVRVIARLRKGVSIAQAENELNKLFQRTEWDTAKQNFGDTFTLGSSKIISLRDATVGDVRSPLYLLLGAGLFLLAICCLNAATLFLARSSRRSRETAIRLALGAGSKDVVIELVTETLLLSLGVGIGALVVGYAGVHAVLAASPSKLPRIGANGSAITLDWKVFLFAFTVSILCGAMCVVFPAAKAAGANINVLVSDSAARSGMTFARNRWRPALVILEMCLSLVLLVGAALLMRTFVARRAINRGFEEQNVLTLDMSLNDPRFDETKQVSQMVRYAESQIRAIPGVEAVATTNALPLLSSLPMPFSVILQEQYYGRFNGTATWRSISPNYFKVFRIMLVRGRFFTDHDDENAPGVVIINRAMMSMYWQQVNANPIGHFIQLGRGWDSPRQIVGVVADVHDASLDRDPSMYVPLAQVPDQMNARDNRLSPLIWTIRTDKARAPAETRFQEELIGISGGQPVAPPITMHDALAASSARYEFYLMVLTLFAVMALCLTASGLYGFMSYLVQQRERELAIRAALGATPLDVQAIVVRQALRLTIFGLLAGIPCALAVARITVSAIFGIQPWDPLTLGLVTASLCVVSLMAAYVPSLRASRIDPAVALLSDV
jgi:putative ABC transport system permease protein